MRHYKTAAGPTSLGLIIIVMLIASTSALFGGKLSSGRSGQAAGGSYVRATVNGITFTHTLSPGELAEDASAALAVLIDAHPNFIASTTTVPAGPFELDDVFLEVLTATSSEVDSLFACETDGTYQNSGIQFNNSRLQVVILKPIAVAGGGVFNIRFDLWDAPDVDETFVTSAGNVSGLINAITNTLVGLGFTVVDNGSQLIISKSADSFMSQRVSSTDTLITETCIGLNNPPPSSPGPGISMPSLRQYGVLLLVAGLLLAGILKIRRMGIA